MKINVEEKLKELQSIVADLVVYKEELRKELKKVDLDIDVMSHGVEFTKLPEIERATIKEFKKVYRERLQQHELENKRRKVKNEMSLVNKILDLRTTSLIEEERFLPKKKQYVDKSTRQVLYTSC